MMTDSQRAATQFVEVNDNEVKIVDKSLLDKTRQLVAVIGPTGIYFILLIDIEYELTLRRWKEYYV